MEIFVYHTIIREIRDQNYVCIYHWDGNLLVIHDLIIHELIGQIKQAVYIVSMLTVRSSMLQACFLMVLLCEMLALNPVTHLSAPFCLFGQRRIV